MAGTLGGRGLTSLSLSQAAQNDLSACVMGLTVETEHSVSFLSFHPQVLGNKRPQKPKLFSKRVERGTHSYHFPSLTDEESKAKFPPSS